jgi:hypothetical protein
MNQSVSIKHKTSHAQGQLHLGHEHKAPNHKSHTINDGIEARAYTELDGKTPQYIPKNLL